MNVKIIPSACKGEVTIPPSKSLAHRAIICAALVNGESVIANVDYSDDIEATIQAMRQLGARIVKNDAVLVVQGIRGLNHNQSLTVDCRESGSTLRFLIPLFSLTGQKVAFLGRNRLLRRPQHVYKYLFQQQAISFSHLPESIHIEGTLQSGTFELAGNVSSQFVSGLLFALPLLEGDSKIIIQPPLESESYFHLTITMLQRFGIRVYFENPFTIVVPGGQSYQPCCYTVEGDYSQMAFYAALGVLNHDLRCLGLSQESEQGDSAIVPLLQSMQGTVEWIEDGYQIRKSSLEGFHISLADCPDLGPILMVLAAHAKGNSLISQAERLRYKESDRIAAMEMELRKFGVKMATTEGEIYLSGGGSYRCQEPLSGHGDHRIVMSLAVMATIASTPVVITGAEAVAKSYPHFFKDLQSIGIEVEWLDELLSP